MSPFVSRIRKRSDPSRRRVFSFRGRGAIQYREGVASSEQGRGFFVSGGTLPFDSPSYVERAADRLLFGALSEGRYCYVLNSRQMGKSSLSVHTMGRLEQAGFRTAYLDLTRIGGKNVSPEQWYTGLAAEIARSLGLTRELARYWKEHGATGPMRRLFDALRHVMLEPRDGEVASPLVVFLDEIDATRSLPFDVDEFFAGIRECFNRRVLDEAYGRLTFCLIGVGVPGDLIRNPATTPFNIGDRVPLEDFTLSEMQPFAEALGTDGERLLRRVHRWTGGHPFLTQSICRALTRQERIRGVADVDATVRRELFDFKVRNSNINLADVANIALHYGDVEPEPLRFRASVLATYQRMLAGREVIDDEANRVAVVLKLSGLAKTDGRRLTVRNRIYRHVFDRAWIEENMPDQEMRRLRQSFVRGVTRAGAVSGGVLLAIGGLAVYAWKSRLDALEARAELDYQLYVADMTSLRTFFEQGDTAKIEGVLARHRRSAHRGFEWGYWLARFHDAKEEYTLDYDAPGKREEGHISTDGTQVCLVDMLTRTATVIDRATRKPVLTAKLKEGEEVLTLQDRFALGRIEVPCYAVRDFATQRLLARVSIPGRLIHGAWGIEHTNLFRIHHGGSMGVLGDGIALWDLGKNQMVWSPPRGVKWRGPFGTSNDGTRLLYGRTTGKRDEIEVVVIDTLTNQVLDRTLGTDDTQLLTWEDGSDSYLLNRPDAIVRREIGRHRQTVVLPPDLGQVRAVRPLGGGQLAWQFEGDLGIVSDPKAPLGEVRRENVFHLSVGSQPGQYLASATSVRVYNPGDTGTGQVIARGNRVTRFAPGQLNVFVGNPNTIRRIDEISFGPVGELPPVTGGRDYTYHGHWSVVTDGKSWTAVSADPSVRPIKLPFVPAIWAAGPGLDRFVLWRQRDSRLVMMSPQTGKTRWEKKDFGGTQAIWISPDGSRMLATVNDLYVQVFDTADGRPLGILSSHNIGPINVSFTRDGTGVFTCGGDGRAVLWDLKSLRKRREFRGNALRTISSADLSPDGRRVATASRSGSWQLWDASNGVQLLDVSASKRPLSTVLFVGDGSRILTAGDDYQVRVWSTVQHDPTIRIPIDPALLKGVHP